MFCGECGTKNEAGSNFCENCGAKLENKKKILCLVICLNKIKQF